MGFRRSLVRIQSPRLVRNSKSRQRLREPLLAGFELLHGRFTLSRLYAAQGSRPRREAARAFSPNQTRLLGKPVCPRAATCRRRSARRRRASRHRRLLSPQLTAFFTSAPILASSAAVNSFRAKAVGHMAPSSRFALSPKPNVAYLVLNLCALLKKQTTLPSLSYAVIPYQVLGERSCPMPLTMAWSH